MSIQFQTSLSNLSQTIKAVDAIVGKSVSSPSAIDDFCRALAEAIYQIGADIEPLADACTKEGWRNYTDKLEYYHKVSGDTAKLLDDMQLSNTVDLPPRVYLDTIVACRGRILAIPLEYRGRKDSASVEPSVEEAEGLDDVVRALEKLFGVVQGKLLRLWHEERD